MPRGPKYIIQAEVQCLQSVRHYYTGKDESVLTLYILRACVHVCACMRVCINVMQL